MNLMIMMALQIVGWLLLGTVIIVGGVAFGLPYLIAKAAKHDQSTCDCWDCQGRRHRSVERAKAKGVDLTKPQIKQTRHVAKGEEDRDPNDYWSTEELRTGHHVFIKGTVYEIGLIRGLPDGNTQVNMRNLLTQVSTMIIVTRNMKRIKMWRKGFGQDLWR